MAVVKTFMGEFNIGDICVANDNANVWIGQYQKITSSRPSNISIKSRHECDDLIIALMVARDTLWPIQPTTE